MNIVLFVFGTLLVAMMECGCKYTDDKDMARGVYTSKIRAIDADEYIYSNIVEPQKQDTPKQEKIVSIREFRRKEAVLKYYESRIKDTIPRGSVKTTLPEYLVLNDTCRNSQTVKNLHFCPIGYKFLARIRSKHVYCSGRIIRCHFMKQEINEFPVRVVDLPHLKTEMYKVFPVGKCFGDSKGHCVQDPPDPCFGRLRTNSVQYSKNLGIYPPLVELENGKEYECREINSQCLAVVISQSAITFVKYNQQSCA